MQTTEWQRLAQVNLVRDQTGSNRINTNPTHLFEVRLGRLQDRSGFRSSREQEVDSWTCLVRNGTGQENRTDPTHSVSLPPRQETAILAVDRWLQGKFRHPALFLDRKAVAACFLQNPVHVVFHSLRGKVQLRGNLFVRQTLGDHGNELLFASSQRQTRAKAQLGHPSRLFGKIREQAQAQTRWAHRLAL